MSSTWGYKIAGYQAAVQALTTPFPQANPLGNLSELAAWPAQVVFVSVPGIPVWVGEKEREYIP